VDIELILYIRYEIVFGEQNARDQMKLINKNS